MIPSSIEEVTKKGEQELDLRIKMLRNTDKASWLAVDNFVTDPFCENDKDDKKWTRAVREAKEEAEMKKKAVAAKRNQGAGYKDSQEGK